MKQQKQCLIEITCTTTSSKYSSSILLRIHEATKTMTCLIEITCTTTSSKYSSSILLRIHEATKTMSNRNNMHYY